MKKDDKYIEKIVAEFYPPNLNLRERELFLMGYKKAINECKKIMGIEGDQNER